MTNFLNAKEAFDAGPGLGAALDRSLVPVHGQFLNDIAIRNQSGLPYEEYYKWQFVYGLINAGLYSRDRMGVEVHFPKGTGSDLKLDGAIFDDPGWLEHYRRYWNGTRSNRDLEWLSEHLLVVMEFKRNEPNMERVFMKQLKPAMREKDPGSAFILGIFYDRERLLLFQRVDGKYVRYDQSKTRKDSPARSTNCHSICPTHSTSYQAQRISSLHFHPAGCPAKADAFLTFTSSPQSVPHRSRTR